MINIREATSSDIATLAGFQQQLAWETENIRLDSNILTLGMQALFTDPGKGRYYVARDGDDTVGCFMVTFEWSDWRNGTVFWLQSVYVIPSYRKKGVFREMYNHLRQQIQQDPDARGLRLYVDKSNDRAMKVYEAMGMDGSHYTVYEDMK